MKAKLIKTIDGYELFTQGFLKGSTNHGLIESLNIEEGPIRYKLSLKNCEAIERGYDLDELADEFSRKFPNDSEPIRYASFIIGAKTILEILGDKKFSEKDVISMIEKSRETGLTAEYLILNNQQNEWGVEIVTEPMNIDEIREQGKGFLHCNTDKYKLDVKGEIILKRI